MIKSFAVLLSTLAVHGMSFSPYLETKLIGGVLRKSQSGFSAIAALRSTRDAERVCVCIIIHEFVAVTAGYCILCRKKLPSNGGLFVRTGKCTSDVKYMEYHDEYKVHGQKEFDIGMVGVEKPLVGMITLPDVFIDVETPDRFLLKGFCGLILGHCHLEVVSVFDQICTSEEKKIAPAEDRLFYIVPANQNSFILKDDVASPVYNKYGIIVGMVSGHFVENPQSTISCTKLNAPQIRMYIQEALDRTLGELMKLGFFEPSG